MCMLGLRYKVFAGVAEMKKSAVPPHEETRHRALLRDALNPVPGHASTGCEQPGVAELLRSALAQLAEAAEAAVPQESSAAAPAASAADEDANVQRLLDHLVSEYGNPENGDESPPPPTSAAVAGTDDATAVGEPQAAAGLQDFIQQQISLIPHVVLETAVEPRGTWDEEGADADEDREGSEDGADNDADPLDALQGASMQQLNDMLSPEYSLGLLSPEYSLGL